VLARSGAGYAPSTAVFVGAMIGEGAPLNKRRPGR
jgi:hypothetical protein